MFELLFNISGPMLAMASIIMALLALGAFIFQDPSDRGDEDWRDPAPGWYRSIKPIVKLFVNRVERRTSPQRLQQIENRLVMAGMAFSVRPAEMIVARRIFFCFGLFLFAYTYGSLDPSSKVQYWLIVIAGMAVPVFYFWPDVWLRDTIKIRHNRIEKEFPFFLDLQVLAMRAGLNFTSAISQAVDRLPTGPVREEFSRLMRDIRTGRSRKEALRALSDRVGMVSIANYVAAVNQAEETGGELAQILMRQAEQRRSERFIRAEELANKAPVKMLFPIVAFLFPMIFIIIGFEVYMSARETGAIDFFVRK